MSDSFCASCAGLGVQPQAPHDLCCSCNGHGRTSAAQAVLDGTLGAEDAANGSSELTRDVPVAVLGDESAAQEEESNETSEQD